MKRNASQAKEMFAHIERCMSSGLSQSAFCEQHQVVPHIFYYWLSRYRRKHTALEQTGFIAVSVTAVKQSESATMEILNVNGNRIGVAIFE